MADNILESESIKGDIPFLDSLSNNTIAPANFCLSNKGAIKQYTQLVL